MQTQTKSISMQQLLQAWQQADLVPATENSAIINACLTHQKLLPLYLRILIGIGALFAVNFFLGFFYAAHIIDFNSTTAQIIWGLIFIALAIVASYRAKNRNSAVDHSFLIQSSFCAMWLGKLLFVMGFTHLFRNTLSIDDSITLSLLIVTLITYALYQVSIDRFLSTLATLIFLLLTITERHTYSGIAQLELNLFFLIQLTLTAFLFLYPNVKKQYIPLAYALACSLTATVIYFASVSTLHYWGYQVNYNLFFIKTFLIVALISVIAWAAREYKALTKEPLRTAALGILLLGIIAEPGILLGLCFMIVGYARYEKALLLLGMVLVPIFVFFYYYNLDVNFLTKSVVLVASGLLLLAARGYLSLKKLDREI